MAEVVKGLIATLKKLDALEKDLSKEVEAIVEANAREMELKAKRNASGRPGPKVITGKLRQSIRAYKSDELSWKLAANTNGIAPYAPYIEFGTGGLVNVPPELQNEASKFRGRGIRKVNLRPRPYLFPAFLSQRRQYLSDLEDLLDRETKKI